MTKQNSYSVKIRDKQTTFTYLGNQFQPPFSEVTSVTAVPFTAEGQIVAVNLRKRGWDLPGGHVEDGETNPIDTLNREIMEEAYMTVRDPLLIEVIESDFFEERQSYMLIYAVVVDEIFDFVATDEVSERQFMSDEEFVEKYQAGDTRLMEQAVLKARKLIKK